eukprot:CAMPEP_0119282602 /NCGR_PEP_ID=MMETSP1329-20130426/27007_1 /TAXON_ID=114041 /ORGANISM="Genus nov. species nov., Strain RCC1024" /LENGTH=92 /DNA_ID=CAMNT_0007283265 /DNA_START=284 /DNA_END=558 /DNA_ORIENTATION=+
MDDEPVRTTAIDISGLARTRPAFVEAELADVRRASTFGGLVKALDAVVKDLEATDLFSKVTATLDAAGGPAPLTGEAGPQPVRVALELAEKR